MNTHFLNPVKKLVLSTMPDSALMPLKKAYYARLLRKSSGEEEPELRILADLVKAGDCVFDIGANIGVYTKRLSALVGPRGNVVSMEPMPNTFAFLHSNVDALGLANVRCMNVAVSDHAGHVAMETPTYDEGWQNIYRAHIVDSTGGTIQAIALDEAFHDLTRLDFVKCDVEGHEPAVLRGAAELIKKHHPKWLIEIDGDPDDEGTQAWQTFSTMAGHGYKAFVPRGQSLQPREPGMIAINYFFL